MPVPLRILLFLMLAAGPMAAAQYSGSVRAADQFVPGAAITAKQGDLVVKAFSDENGRYSMDLGPGDWDVEVQMFEFTTARGKVSIGGLPALKEWTLEMPRVAERQGVTPAKTAPVTASGSRQNRSTGRAGGGRGGAQAGAQARPQFQSATVRPAPGEPPAAELTDPAQAATALMESVDSEESFLVNGSTSGGLSAATDDESRRQRAAGGGGGRGGQNAAGAGFGPALDGGAANGLGLPPGMNTNDSLGLGGFGAAAINGGFGIGATGGDGGFGAAGGGGRGGAGGGGRGGGGGGAGGGGRGGGGGRAAGGGRGGRGAQTRRGPFNGQFASFGNRRRVQSPYSGNVSFTLQNSALNAAPFSLNGRPSEKPYSATNNLAITFGGPMVIPKLLHWQAASFNISYRGALDRRGSNLLGSVPTLAERGGDFSGAYSNTPVTLYDPLNGQPFANNVIPASRINPVSAGLLQFFPTPIYPGQVQNYRLITTVPNDSQSIGVRLSAPITKKDRANVNVQYQTRSSQSRQLFGFTDEGTGSGISASVAWSHSFAARFNNNANLTFSRNVAQNTPSFAFQRNIVGELGITGTDQDPINYGPPALSFTNFSGLTDSAASLSRSQTMNLTDSVTYVFRKKHNLTFGFLYRKLQQNSLNYQNSRGSFSFSGLLTSQLNAAGQPVSGTGYDFADFLLGLPQSSSLRFGSVNNYFRGWATSWYGQDDFRVSRGLTLNLGLRYEYFSPYTELRGHLANLDVNQDFTAVAVVTPGGAGPYSGGLPTSLVRSQVNSWSPRIGVAWRPSTKHSFLIRSGYSIFFSGSPYAQIANSLSAQPPFARTASLSTSVDNPLTIQNGFPTAPAQNVTNTFAVDPNYKLAYAQNWNFTLQNTLPHGLVMETEYIGTKGTDLAINEQPNRTLAGSSLAAQQLKIANATGFTYLTSGANSTFNAGQLRMTRRFTRGLSATALYTFSKAIDNASSFNGTGGTLVQFLNNLALERGLSTFDQRHNLQTTFLFSSPVGVRGFLRNGGWRAKALAGWTLSGTYAVRSGTPLTAYVSGNLANTGGLASFGNSRAQATGVAVDAGNPAYFNPAAFTLPPSGQFGNAGRNTIPGLFQFSLNSALNRSFRIGDSRRTLQFRLSATNALNHITITSIGTTVNSATYGIPTAASGTRNLNAMLRFSF